MEQLPRLYLSRDEMHEARRPLQGPQGLRRRPAGQQDAGLRAHAVQRHRLPAAERHRAGAVTSPVGDHAARLAAIKISEGFNLGYCKAKPGQGPVMHNHDTNETFIAMTGTWRASWEDENGQGRICRSWAARRCVVSARHDPPFENVTKGDPNAGIDPDVRDRR